MLHLQTQVGFEVIEIAVPMQQFKSPHDTERSDEAINRLANGDAPSAKIHEISCRLGRNPRGYGFEDRKLKQIVTKGVEL